MYVVIRRTRLVGSPDEAGRHARDQIVPLLRGWPGFRSYCAFVTEQGDAAYAIGVFDDEPTAMDAHRRVRAWIEANLRDLMPDEPEIVAGEAVFHEVAACPQLYAQPERGQPPPFVVIRKYDGVAGQTEAMHSMVSQHTLPVITGSPGFLGFYAFRDRAKPSRAVSVTLFATREEALRAHERVVEIMRARLGALAPRPPRTAMGEAVALAVAM